MTTRALPRTLLALAALCLLALLACLDPDATALAAQTTRPTFWTGVDATPLRAERSGQAEVLKTLPRGLPVRLLRSEGAWCLVLEPGGGQGWVYQGHLEPMQPRQTPLPIDLFAPPPGSLVLAEAADTSRSSRSMHPERSPETQALWTVLELPLTRQDLDEFLRAGGVGEYAHVNPQTHGGPARLPVLKAEAPSGGLDERTLGLNLAVAVARRVAKPAFGVALQRYVNLVGLSVARFAPGNALSYRFVVLDSPTPMTFSLPGGIVLISSGLLHSLDNEAQLACILAREAAKASLGQVWARAKRSDFFRSGGAMTEDGMRSPLFARLLDDMLELMLRRGFDAREVGEADAAAIQMAYRAGYDPLQLAAALRNVERAAGCGDKAGVAARPGEQPQLGQRIRRIQALLAQLPAQDGLALGSERFRANR